MQGEIEALESALASPKRPVVAVIGGAKVSSKIDVLENLAGKVDALVVGGGMANTFLLAKGIAVGKSLAEPDLVDTAKKIMAAADKAGSTIVLPVDVVVAKEFKEGAAATVVPVDAVPADQMILDIGPRSIEAVNAWIDKAATLVWNGPLGAFEVRALRQGDGRRRAPCGIPEGQGAVGRRRRRDGIGAPSCGRGRRLQLHLDRRRRLPRMAGGQGASRRRGSPGAIAFQRGINDPSNRRVPVGARVQRERHPAPCRSSWRRSRRGSAREPASGPPKQRTVIASQLVGEGTATAPLPLLIGEMGAKRVVGDA